MSKISKMIPNKGNDMLEKIRNIFLLWPTGEIATYFSIFLIFKSI